MQTAYPALVTSFHDKAFVVTFRDVPEAVTAGVTRGEALNRARCALREALKGYVQFGRCLPTPSAPETGEDLVAVSLQSSAA